MASSFSLIPFLALFLVSFSHIALSLSSKSFLPFHKPIISQKKIPLTLAEKFIRQLNLFPKHDVNIISSKDNIAQANEERLFEKKLNLPYLGDSGATVQDLGHHAGYFPLLHTKAARMFYFFFESRSNKNDPVVIWLTGGPGCSSELALFYENGPFKLSDNMSLVWNDFGWDKYYDIRKKCEGNLCYDFSGMENYLNDGQVKQALGVPNSIDFVSCSSTVYQAMETDWMKNLEVGIPSLLEDGINLLIYAGKYDLICNWLGNSNWVHAVEWSGQNDFVAAPSASFTVDGVEKGIQKSYGPLTFLKVHDAGHMVPMDQPKAALEMLQRWTTQGKLS